MVHILSEREARLPPRVVDAAIATANVSSGVSLLNPSFSVVCDTLSKYLVVSHLEIEIRYQKMITTSNLWVFGVYEPLRAHNLWSDQNNHSCACGTMVKLTDKVRGRIICKLRIMLDCADN